MTDFSATAPDDALDTLANLLAHARFADAAAAAAELRRRFPADAEAARLHALALLQLGHAADARVVLEEARQLAPASIEVLCNLGSVQLAAGDARAALDTLHAAFALAPAHPAVLNGLGNARRAAGDPSGACAAYEAATRAAPNYVGAWFNLAAARLALGEAGAAERDIRHALTLAPGHPEGLLLLGHALAARAQFGAAANAYAAGARAAPQDARFAYQIGLMAEEQKQFAAAADAHARALSLDPNLHHALGQLVFLRRQLCDWRDLDALSADLRARVAASAKGIAPFAFLSEPASAAEQLHCARTAAAAIEANAAPLRAHLAWAQPRVDDATALRVGFVSNGFGDHPTGLLIVAMIEALREQAVEVHLFATSADDGGAIRRRLRDAAHRLHEVAGLGPVALAEHIRATATEILVDLRGYGGGSVADTLALRPAPLQVGWLAYPGTSGSTWLDYVIADRSVLPEALRVQFSERVAWLPRCFQPSDPTRVVGEPPSRAACGLPPAGVVYACFNNSYKINPASFERLLAVLRAVPDAVLWLLSGPDGADQRLRAEAQRRGIDAARLVFLSKLPHAEYLARYRHADLFLDTAPYNAHTTASDAIWAGCPVLTCAGETFAARVAASLNHHLGLPQLNAPDDAAFIETAIRFGRDAQARARLQRELAERRRDSGLFDMQGFARDFALVLREMSRRHRDGLAPAAFG
ncbi:MAG TPA: UDP-N-acetylglucosamine-peptide N-acetylglucosaminyltransferase [Dokdonella sp.]